MQVLPLSTTLAVALLACWVAREAVGPLDLAQLALDGELQYLNFSEMTVEPLAPHAAVFTRNFLTPSGEYAA